jgi:two-component system, response regulator PdtaR
MADSLRVLIADDEPIARLDLKRMLQNLGHVVVAEASDGDTALRLAEEMHPDLAILDVRMPGQDGLEVARRLAAEKIAPTLILSAFSEKEYLDRSREAGCLCYLVKPLREKDLAPAIATTAALHDRLYALERDIEDLQEALQTRKAVERAKGILMDRLHISENEAFRRIQQESMESRRYVREVAEEIISRHT